MVRESGIGDEAADRAARREAGGVVVRALALEARGSAGAAFVRRRAEREVARLGRSEERRLLTKLLEAPGEARVLAKLLAAYAAELERQERLGEAAAALLVARRLWRDSPELVLRAARVARLAGCAGRARRLYARVRMLDGDSGHWSRLAAVGEALLSQDPQQALTAAIQAAVESEDDVAVVVGLEERAALRRAQGDEAGADRDRCVAAFRSARVLPSRGGRRAVTPRG